MSKKTNFKKIFIVIGVLLALLLIIKIKDQKQGERSFKAFVLQVDTAKVDAITITPKGSSDNVRLEKRDAGWFIHTHDKWVQADEETIEEVLSQVQALKTKSVAATSEKKWEAFEVTDSLGTRVTLNQGTKPLSDFVVGKFSYTQAPNTNPYAQQPNILMTSYLRLSDAREVYAVDGYLSMLFNRDAQAFRENGVLTGKPETWKKLIFSYPADSSFTLVNQNNTWMVNGIMADSAAVASFFSQIRMLSSSSFDDETQITSNQTPLLSLRIEGDNTAPLEVKAYKNSADEWVYLSSQNKENLMKSATLKETLFVGKNNFAIP